MTPAPHLPAAFFESYLRLRPVNATFTGDYRYDDRLPDWSAAGLDAARDEMQSLRSQLAAGSTLSGHAITTRDWGAIDAALADSFLEIQLAELGGRHFQRGNPSLAAGEVAFGIISLVTGRHGTPAERGERVCARLHDTTRFLSGALAALGDGGAPTTWVDRALRECGAVQQFLGAGLRTWGDTAPLSDAAKRRLHDAATSAQQAIDVFATGVAALPRDTAPARLCGREMLELLVRRGHWCTRSADDLLREVRDGLISERVHLEGMARAASSDGLPGVQARLAEAHPDAADYYEAFQRTWEACRALTEQRALVTWPDAPIRYIPIPEATREVAPSLYYLYYRSPAPLDWPDVHHYVVTPVDGLAGEALARHLRLWNDSVIKLNHVVHHGALGHHVQNWYAAHAPSAIGRIAATDCASRIGMFLGGTMAEGWACYATGLMDDAGFLTDDECVAEQQSRVRMLVRAVVDLEFHTGARTFEDAVALHVDASGMSPAAAHAEVVKCSMFPGTALMYWLGTSQIHALRRSREAALGTRFAPRAFHDAFLSHGAIPVALAARLMEEWTGGHDATPDTSPATPRTHGPDETRDSDATS